VAELEFGGDVMESSVSVAFEPSSLIPIRVVTICDSWKFIGMRSLHTMSAATLAALTSSNRTHLHSSIFHTVNSHLR
jgi:hypothetical protein